jgi:putative toxin-antitoxin system antitoxin component (TIGR02293 family)
MQSTLKEYLPASTDKKDIWKTLEIPSRGPELHLAIHDGFRYEIFDQIASLLMLDKKNLGIHANIAPATLARRSKAGRFTPDESDRLYSFAQVMNSATDLFEGDLSAARQWMVEPVHGLGNRLPITMLASRVETEAVLDLIGRLEHGVLA